MEDDKPADLLAQRRAKMAMLRAEGINPFPSGVQVSHTVAGIKQSMDDRPDEALHTTFAVAGRMMAINSFGKSAFVRFRDYSGQMQAYIRKDKLGEEAYALFKRLDIGDIVGLTGTLFQTKTGEWTLLATSLVLLCKATRPLPEKFHGLKDPEKRYRQRYVDLIMNGDVKRIFITRSRAIQAIRDFFLQRDYLEVETPMMQPLAGGAEATPFATHHNALDMDLYLRIAPELYLKRLVVGGFERVFEINRNFRNEGISTQHNPEFTMLEFYQAHATYQDLMALSETLFASVAEKVLGTTTIVYQGREIQLQGPWQRMTLTESMEKLGGVNPAWMTDRQKLIEFASAKGVHLTKTRSIGKIITKIFDVLVEPQLIQPTFITGYPVEVSPLSRRSESDPGTTERFELFIAGFEIANGFSELNDPEDQRSRFEQQVLDRQAGDEEAHQMDEDYIEALEYGMPPTAGEGIGIDRMAMLLTDSPSIREVILFPHMKPKYQ
ncbi:MAG: lysine--tRNA ligase [Desulfobacteraceae bacterium]|nr:MAG: lysine--tRNA ligase [Desulfobacteraceae bacterium]